jgi:ribonucleotide reductase alpha subunit
MSYTYEQVLEASITYFKGDKQQAQTFVDFYALKDESGKYLELTPQDMENRIKDSNFVDGIKIDLSRDNLFDEHGLARLKDSYMKEGENSPQERYAFVSKTFSTNQYHAQRLYEYSSKHWLSYSTPLLSFGRSKRGLNISCYLSSSMTIFTYYFVYSIYFFISRVRYFFFCS